MGNSTSFALILAKQSHRACQVNKVQQYFIVLLLWGGLERGELKNIYNRCIPPSLIIMLTSVALAAINSILFGYFEKTFTNSVHVQSQLKSRYRMQNKHLIKG